MAPRSAVTRPPEKRLLQTPGGAVDYTLTRKRVRNLNLRVRRDGSVAVSAPTRMPVMEIERFLATKADWVVAHRETLLNRKPEASCTVDRQTCEALFRGISDEIFPLFSEVLEGQKPTLRLREMKSRWGSCNPCTRTITLNTHLAEKPRAAVEYVILHEYVHFIHPNHQAPFHAEMARLMPDYRQRKKLLRED